MINDMYQKTPGRESLRRGILVPAFAWGVLVFLAAIGAPLLASVGRAAAAGLVLLECLALLMFVRHFRRSERRAAALEQTLAARDRAVTSTNDSRVRRMADTDAALRGEALRDPNGVPVRMVGAAADVTDSRRMARALAESERGLKHAESLARVGHYSSDFDGANPVWSEGVLTMWGFEPGFSPHFEEFVSRIHPDDRDGVLQAVQRGIETYTSFERVHRIVHPDGSQRTVRTMSEFVPGETPRIFGASIDVTELKSVEVALAQFKSTLHQTLDCVFMFRPDDFRFTYVNLGACQQVGYTEDEMLSLTPLDINRNTTSASFSNWSARWLTARGHRLRSRHFTGTSKGTISPSRFPSSLFSNRPASCAMWPS